MNLRSGARGLVCPNRFEVVLECLHVTKLFTLGGQLKHLLGLASMLNPCQFLLRACLKFSAFGQVIMERWCGVFIENLQHCQKAGTFRSFEERSGSDAFILFLQSIQESLPRPPSRPQTL